ncbi:hypothetical protein SDC9_95154 [bioreactor metagenome]|uniref:DUF4349 domain-containing protein n=1 Tax=bioreactor metagenome TaxID=1076179 RepID=A0A645A5G1_9ZZZZ
MNTRRNRFRPLALLLLFALLLSACSSTTSSSGSTSAAKGDAGSGAPTPAPSMSLEYQMSEAGETSVSDSAGGTVSGSSGTSKDYGSRIYTDADAKLIREAYISVQTTSFTDAVAALNTLVNQHGGYFEDAKVQSGGYYDANAQRYASYTIRIPEESYEDFLNAAGNVGHVVSSSESSKDVGEEYYDTELRLKTLTTKQERLLALLDKAEAMEDIISLENALSDVQYQIEQYTSTLKRYDALVDFATIRLDLYEVVKVEDDPGETASLGTKLAAAFRNGFSEFGDGMSSLILWVAYHFLALVIFAAVVWAGFYCGRRTLRRRREKKEHSEDKT